MTIGTGKKPLHLTYCLNIHAGEQWQENLRAIATHACAVRDRIAAGKPFGLGLRLSAVAAQQLDSPGTLAKFKDFLAQENLYVFTINGFPYGTFHGAPVKQHVYAPDWASPERLQYTNHLITILGRLLPAGVDGSISTVPGTYRAWSGSTGHYDRMLLGLARAAVACRRIAEQKNRVIRLALEPEPDCIWDTTDHMIGLLTRDLIYRGVDLAGKADGLPRKEVRQAIRSHLGVCLDTCHQSVMFEHPAASLEVLQRHDVPIAKIQISAAPRCAVTPAALAQLAELQDDVYLHQTFIRKSDGALERYPDLPEALAAASAWCDTGAEIRTHCHIPLCISHVGEVYSTRDELDAQFFAALRSGVCSHLEIETYTFSVLPEELRQDSVDDNIVSEIQWFSDQMSTRS